MRKMLYLTLTLSQLLCGAVEIPRYFEANTGQAPSQVRFLSRSADHTVFLTCSEAVFAGAAGSISLRFINSRAGVEPVGIHAVAGPHEVAGGRAHALGVDDPPDEERDRERGRDAEGHLVEREVSSLSVRWHH